MIQNTDGTWSVVDDYGKSYDTEIKALVGLAESGVMAAADVIKAVMQASMSNPLMGIMAAFASGAVLHKAGIFTDQEWANIKILIFAAGGISLTVDIIKAIESIVPFTSGTSVPTAPSGTVLVFGDSNNAQLNALLAKLGKT